jgi:hypothetical protein
MVCPVGAKMCFTSALILAFSPGEKESQLNRIGFAEARPANPVADFSKRRRTFLLLFGEKAGMREDVAEIVGDDVRSL